MGCTICLLSDEVLAKELYHGSIEFLVKGCAIESSGVDTDVRQGPCGFGRARDDEGEMPRVGHDPVVGLGRQVLVDRVRRPNEGYACGA